MHLLIERETYHRDFVEHQCIGFDELAAHVKPFTPAWAARAGGRRRGAESSGPTS